MSLFQLQDAGVYQCMARNGNGTAVSDKIVLQHTCKSPIYCNVLEHCEEGVRIGECLGTLLICFVFLFCDEGVCLFGDVGEWALPK